VTTSRNRLAPGALLSAVLAFAAAPAALAQSEAAPPNNPAPAQQRQAEPNNVLRSNEDAAFTAAKARRQGLLDRLTPITEATLKAPADGDWLTWRRTPLSDGFSPLKAINRTNVKGLKGAWSYVLPQSGNEITPLVHDGVLFVQSGNTTLAIDGASGDLLWQYVRPMPPAQNSGRGIVRNIALYGDRLFAPTLDGHLVALDVKTGKVVWDHPVLGEAELKARMTLNSGPLVAKGKVIMGVTGCNSYKGGCFIFALDAATGAEAWRFHTLDQSPPGQDSWNGAPVNERYGGSVWTAGSYDPDLNLVYFGVGNTYTTGTLLLPHAEKGKSSDGLYTASTVALDPDTGRLVWHYQHVPREVWDLDWVFERALVTVPVDGKPTKLVVTGGKIALFDGVDRATGRYAFSRDAGIQSLITAVDPKTGAKTINPALTPEPGVTKHFCPHSGGGRNWPATSIDPVSKIMYVQMFETCQDFTWRPRTPEETAAGVNDMQWVQKPRDGSDGRFGRVQAIDLKTGKTVWTQRRRAAFASSTLATGGGLVFVGARDRYFYAYDSANGKPLWRARLAASPSATPITYSAGGRQYVAVVAGNGGPVAWPFLTPEIENPSGGLTLTVFALPEAGETPAD
jgi:alcohol dehydrogenase (cytochrome c)